MVFVPGAPCADPRPPAPPTEKRNPAGGTQPRSAELLARPALVGPRPALGGARGRPTYLRVPTARPQVAAAVAATAAGPGSRAPGPLWPPTSLGAGGPTWAARSSHISAEGQQNPTPPSPATDCGGAASTLRPRPAAPAARGAPRGPAPREVVRGPRPTRVPPAPELQARARGTSRDF